jgi:micrococcal nuclease
LIIEFLASAVMSVTISRAIDGDTLKTTDGQTIRLLYIDAPELKQKFGKESKDSLSCIVGEKVKLDSKGKDKYGRTLGVVYVGPMSINEAQILTGMAWAYMIPKDSHYRDFEGIARKYKDGLWADPSPCPPWDFRKGRCK